MLASAYQKLGAFFKDQCTGADVFLLSGNAEATRNMRLRADRKWPISVGGIDCRVLHYKVLPPLSEAGRLKIEGDKETRRLASERGGPRLGKGEESRARGSKYGIREGGAESWEGGPKYGIREAGAEARERRSGYELREGGPKDGVREGGDEGYNARESGVQSREQGSKYGVREGRPSDERSERGRGRRSGGERGGVSFDWRDDVDNDRVGRSQESAQERPKRRAESQSVGSIWT
jgi:hypothetical protein